VKKDDCCCRLILLTLGHNLEYHFRIKPLNPYKPISCQFHDLIEHFATLKQRVKIAFVDGENVIQETDDIIKNWVNNGDGEFLVLTGYQEAIRLDRIISIDNNILSQFC
jgi:Rho-binding antiterminator